jgi:A/G-specific adenine glycosylase
MCQQTRVETVVEYWKKWMIAFPDVQSLAAGSEEQVNSLWSGLGYYRRAQQLLKGARKVVAEFDGVIPSTVEELMSIPGIGRYTAGAICSQAFSIPSPIVDGNVARVLSRLYAIRDEVGTRSFDNIAWALAKDLVDIENPGDFNQAMMELGAIICKPTSPNCIDCPLNSVCIAKLLVERNSGAIKNSTLLTTSKSEIGSSTIIDLTEETNHLPLLESVKLPGDVTIFPFKKPKKRAREVTMRVCILKVIGQSKSSHKYLFVKRPSGTGLLAGQWEFPNRIIDNIDDIDSELDNPIASSGYGLSKEFFEYFHDCISPAIMVESRAGNADPSASISLRNQSISDAISTHNNDVERFCLISSHFIDEPVKHVFSHEHHIMMVEVHVVERLETLSPVVRSADCSEISTNIIGPSGDVSSSVVIDSKKNIVQLSESIWMDEAELELKGVTTGCKKLIAVASSIGIPKPVYKNAFEKMAHASAVKNTIMKGNKRGKS